MATTSTSNMTVFDPCILPYGITENQWEFYESFLWWLEGFGAVLVGFLGIFFNLITICVLLGGELAANFFNWLLVTLSVFDILFLVNGILEAFRNHFGSTNIHTYMFAVFLFPFRSIVMCCSIYTTVMLAMERYNALVRPISHHGANLRSGKKTIKGYFQMHWVRLFKYIGPIVILASLIYIPKWFEVGIMTHKMCAKNNTNTNKDCSFKYEIVLSGLRSNNHYNLWYLNILNLLVTATAPLLSLVYLNVNIYLKFKQYLQRQPTAKAAPSNGIANQAQEKTRKREKEMIQQTLILFSVVFLFFMFHILRIILNVEEFYSLHRRKASKDMGCQWLQYWAILAAPVSHVLLQINSSINFVIYCYFNKSFRDQLILWLTPILSYVWKEPTPHSRDTLSLTGKECLTMTSSNTRITTVPNKPTQEMARSSAINEIELEID